MQDQHFGDDWQARRTPFGQIQVRHDHVFEKLQQLRIQVRHVAGRVADQVAAEEQVAEQSAGNRRLRRR